MAMHYLINSLRTAGNINAETLNKEWGKNSEKKNIRMNKNKAGKAGIQAERNGIALFFIVHRKMTRASEKAS